MRSSGDSERLDLERDLPVGPEDAPALRRTRRLDSLSPQTYLEFLASLSPPDPAELRRRRGPSGPPFEL